MVRAMIKACTKYLIEMLLHVQYIVCKYLWQFWCTYVSDFFFSLLSAFAFYDVELVEGFVYLVFFPFLYHMFATYEIRDILFGYLGLSIMTSLLVIWYYRSPFSLFANAFDYNEACDEFGFRTLVLKYLRDH